MNDSRVNWVQFVFVREGLRAAQLRTPDASHSHSDLSAPMCVQLTSVHGAADKMGATKQDPAPQTAGCEAGPFLGGPFERPTKDRVKLSVLAPCTTVVEECRVLIGSFSSCLPRGTMETGIPTLLQTPRRYQRTSRGSDVRDDFLMPRRITGVKRARFPFVR